MWTVRNAGRFAASLGRHATQGQAQARAGAGSRFCGAQQSRRFKSAFLGGRGDSTSPRHQIRTIRTAISGVPWYSKAGLVALGILPFSIDYINQYLEGDRGLLPWQEGARMAAFRNDPANRMMSFYQRFDADSDGYVSAGEILNATEDMEGMTGYSAVELLEAFKYAGLNSAAELDFSKVAHIIKTVVLLKHAVPSLGETGVATTRELREALRAIDQPLNRPQIRELFRGAHFLDVEKGTIERKELYFCLLQAHRALKDRREASRRVRRASPAVSASEPRDAAGTATASQQNQ